MPADHHNRGRWVELTEALQRLHSIHSRHLHVEKNEMGTPLLVLGYSVSRISDGADLVSLELEQLSQCSADSLLIVDDENSSTHRTLL